ADGHGVPRPWSRRGWAGRREHGPQRLRQAVELVLVGKERCQLVGQLGMPCQPLLAVRLFAGLDRLQVRDDSFVDALFLGGGVEELVYHKLLALVQQKAKLFESTLDQPGDRGRAAAKLPANVVERPA